MKRILNNLTMFLFFAELFPTQRPPLQPNTKVETVYPPDRPDFNQWLYSVRNTWRYLALLAIIVLCSLQSMAQSQSHAYYISVGKWNKYRKEYDWILDKKPCDLTITFGDRFIAISNEARTEFILGPITSKADNSTEMRTTWSATDQEGRRCRVSMALYRKSMISVVSAIYDDVATVWAFESLNDSY